ncbi:hypothetical protein GQ55_9G223200 [Panicum hallii var. hallii]|uniref:Uncharacterized protein n=1 Tax=Panicum hallii var. hallii TaxID=1504633 RepID=A0A2T7C624_9POAL|nr:hypothetical protein GQ55_9G223200 [Panicum hallii var. hallii]
MHFGEQAVCMLAYSPALIITYPPDGRDVAVAGVASTRSLLFTSSHGHTRKRGGRARALQLAQLMRETCMVAS